MNSLVWVHKRILLLVASLGVALGLLDGWISAGDLYKYCDPSGALNYLIGVGTCLGVNPGYDGRSFLFGLAGLLAGGGITYVLIAILRGQR